MTAATTMQPLVEVYIDAVRAPVCRRVHTLLSSVDCELSGACGLATGQHLRPFCGRLAHARRQHRPTDTWNSPKPISLVVPALLCTSNLQGGPNLAAPPVIYRCFWRLNAWTRFSDFWHVQTTDSNKRRAVVLRVGLSVFHDR